MKPSKQDINVNTVGKANHLCLAPASGYLYKEGYLHLEFSSKLITLNSFLFGSAKDCF